MIGVKMQTAGTVKYQPLRPQTSKDQTEHDELQLCSHRDH